MKNVIAIFLLLGLSFSFSSCKKCGNKIGNQTELKSTLEPFHSLKITGKFIIQLCQDSTYTMKLKGGEGLLSNINYSVKDSTLVIDNTNTCSFTKNYSDGVVLQLGVGPLKELWVSNPFELKNCGFLESDNLIIHLEECAQKTAIQGKFNYLKLTVGGGSSNVTLMGSASDLLIENVGFGQVTATDFPVNTAKINEHSTGSVYVNSKDHLEVNFYGSGNVFYSGSPIIKANEKIKTPGKLIQL